MCNAAWSKGTHGRRRCRAPSIGATLRWIEQCTVAGWAMCAVVAAHSAAMSTSSSGPARFGNADEQTCKPQWGACLYECILDVHAPDQLCKVVELAGTNGHASRHRTAGVCNVASSQNDIRPQRRGARPRHRSGRLLQRIHRWRGIASRCCMVARGRVELPRQLQQGPRHRCLAGAGRPQAAAAAQLCHRRCRCSRRCAGGVAEAKCRTAERLQAARRGNHAWRCLWRVASWVMRLCDCVGRLQTVVAHAACMASRQIPSWQKSSTKSIRHIHWALCLTPGPL